jgi:hypothetical protein
MESNCSILIFRQFIYLYINYVKDGALLLILNMVNRF